MLKNDRRSDDGDKCGWSVGAVIMLRGWEIVWSYGKSLIEITGRHSLSTENFPRKRGENRPPTPSPFSFHKPHLSFEKRLFEASKRLVH
jgi:hypothetical protein